MTDKSSRMAELESVDITNAKFPSVDDKAQRDELSQLIQTQAPKWNLQLSIDGIVAAIKTEDVAMGKAEFKNDPPRILYADKPTTPVVLDGEPEVLNDADLKADNTNWQTRDNRSRDWKPAISDQSNRLPDLNRQQQTRDRAATRETNFSRDVPTIKWPVPPETRPAASRFFNK